MAKARRQRADTVGTLNAGSGLVNLLTHGSPISEVRLLQLQEQLKSGFAFFQKTNELRLKEALNAFDEPMRHALFDVLYLLHVNSPKLEQFTFPALRLERKGGMVREHVQERTISLHVPEAPHGVDALEQLSPTIAQAFSDHCMEVFHDNPMQHKIQDRVVRSIHTLGSIGTLSHKSHDSDLDLEICYELIPFDTPIAYWQDHRVQEALQLEMRHFMGLQAQHMGFSAQQLKGHPELVQKIKRTALQQVRRQYPLLVDLLLLKRMDYRLYFSGSETAQKRSKALYELTKLQQRYLKLRNAAKFRAQEQLWKQRLGLIQNYLTARYPQAEVYLFGNSLENYRRGKHGTTLDSKESSGSAYDLILNHDTLLPGIQVAAAVPLHYLFSEEINNDPLAYERLTALLRCGLLAGMREQLSLPMVDLGSTHTLEQSYIAAHSGAIYWEAFKASSGRLYKAYLNLLRYETLLNAPFNKTVIQLIKNPKELDKLCRNAPQKPEARALLRTSFGMLDWDLIELESDFPALKLDPWWIRYKLLKLAYTQPGKIPGVDEDQARRISRSIDMAFAMHVRISDVFSKPGHRKQLKQHREQVLTNLLQKAFPPRTAEREQLEHLFVGEVTALNWFENELRELFQSCLNRVRQQLSTDLIQKESNQKEFEVWFHYYQRNFEPPENGVQRTIMSHLKVPRGRLQIGHVPEKGWFFRSIQRESRVGKRFDRFGMLEHLPDEVMLIETPSMLRGLTTCILNGYYGIWQPGTLKETRTTLEFPAHFMDLGNALDNQLAFVRPDMVHRLMDVIMKGFPYKEFHYLDCIRLTRKPTELMVCINLNHYGRMGFVVKDNLQSWYVEEFDHPEIFKQAKELLKSPQIMLSHKAFQQTLAHFLKKWKTNLAQLQFSVWVNPNSVLTNHAPQQMPQKEQDLAALFKRVTYRTHAPQLLKSRASELTIRREQVMESEQSSLRTDTK